MSFEYLNIAEFLKSGGVENYGYKNWKNLYERCRSLKTYCKSHWHLFQDAYNELIRYSPTIIKKGTRRKVMIGEGTLEEVVKSFEGEGYTVLNLSFDYKKVSFPYPLTFTKSFLNDSLERPRTSTQAANLMSFRLCFGYQMDKIAEFLGQPENFYTDNVVADLRKIGKPAVE